MRETILTIAGSALISVAAVQFAAASGDEGKMRSPRGRLTATAAAFRCLPAI
jgi:hypothetical protein